MLEEHTRIALASKKHAIICCPKSLLQVVGGKVTCHVRTRFCDPNVFEISFHSFPGIELQLIVFLLICLTFRFAVSTYMRTSMILMI
jgi:hypothetical protein